MRRYETVFIIRSDVSEPQIKEIIKRFEGLAGAAGGTLVETEEWGMRELAYHVEGERRGYYVRLDYVADGAVLNEVERNLKLADNVLRFLSVMVEEGADAEKLRAEAESRKRKHAETKAAAAAPESERGTGEVPDAHGEESSEPIALEVKDDG